MLLQHCASDPRFCTPAPRAFNVDTDVVDRRLTDGAERRALARIARYAGNDRTKYFFTTRSDAHCFARFAILPTPTRTKHLRSRA
jgi:hypothetical protein